MHVQIKMCAGRDCRWANHAPMVTHISMQNSFSSGSLSLRPHVRVGREPMLGGRRRNSFVVIVMSLSTCCLFCHCFQQYKAKSFYFLVQNIACCRTFLLYLFQVMIISQCISFASLQLRHLLVEEAYFSHPEDSCYISCLSSARPLIVHCRYTRCVWRGESEREAAASSSSSLNEDVLLNKLLSVKTAVFILPFKRTRLTNVHNPVLTYIISQATTVLSQHEGVQ